MNASVIDLTRDAAGSGASNDHTYKVTLQTGDSRWGGTDAQVFITLHGDRRTTKELTIKRGILERGSVEEDTLITPFVGNILKITIRHDGVGWAGAWHLRKVTVTDETLYRSWSFDNNDKWLNSDNNNMVVLKPRSGVGAGRLASSRRSSIFHAVESESEEDDPKTVHVIFQVNYYTRDCMTVYTVGSSAALGSWQLDKALRMERIVAFDGSWRGEWQLEVELDNVEDLEYQYVCIDDNSKKHVWESASSRKLNIQGNTQRHVRVRDELDQTPLRSASKKNVSNKALGTRTPLLPAFSPMRAMDLDTGDNEASFQTRRNGSTSGDANASNSGDDDLVLRQHQHHHPAQDAAVSSADAPVFTSTIQEDQDEQRTRIHELESALTAARNCARGRERELASLRAHTLLSPAPGLPSASNNVPIAATEMKATIVDLKSRISCLRKSFSAPLADLFVQVDCVRMTVLDALECQSRELEAARLRMRHGEEALENARALTASSVEAAVEAAAEQRSFADQERQQLANEELLTELETLREAVERAQRDQMLANDLTREAEREKEEANERYNREFLERKRLFNMVQELKGNIRVFCRVRPCQGDRSSCVDVGGREPATGQYRKIGVNHKEFEFDRIFTPDDGQDVVYKDTAAIVTSVLDGYNACVFAYGQTGSGKTYTMNGTAAQPGVNFRALQDLFALKEQRSQMFDTTIQVSMLEIYNETLRDLLRGDDSNPARTTMTIAASAGSGVGTAAATAAGSPVVPRLDIKRGPDGVFVPDLTVATCTSAQEVWTLMNQGAQNRASGVTAMNEQSSRSHLIVSVRVQSTNKTTPQRIVGDLHLVDLAGSERVSRSNAVGDRLKEAAHINKSLSALGDVFMAILARNTHVPFRNSKLTYLLQESLGGNSKTLMLVNVSPEEEDQAETVCSLLFASRVAKVELGAASKRGDGAEVIRLSKELQERDAQRRTAEAKLLEVQREVAAKEKENKEILQARERESTRRQSVEGRLTQLTASIEESEKAKKTVERNMAAVVEKSREEQIRNDEKMKKVQLDYEKRLQAMERQLATARKELEAAVALRATHTPAPPSTATPTTALAASTTLTTAAVPDPRPEPLHKGTSDGVLRPSPLARGPTFSHVPFDASALDTSVVREAHQLSETAAGSAPFEALAGLDRSTTAASSTQTAHERRRRQNAPEGAEAADSLTRNRKPMPTETGTYVRVARKEGRPEVSQESRKRPKVRFDASMDSQSSSMDTSTDENGEGAPPGGGGGGRDPSRSGRSVHFAPTPSGTAGSFGAGAQTKSAAPPGTPVGGAKRIVYAFGTRLEVSSGSGAASTAVTSATASAHSNTSADDENVPSSINLSTHVPPPSSARKQPPSSTSTASIAGRVAQRVVASSNSTPANKSSRPLRRFHV